jgi:hypothetical protein
MPNIDPALAVLIPAAIVGLVDFLKTFGLAGRALTAVSFAIGALVGAGLFFLPAGTFVQVLYIALFGLAASGFYDIAKLIGSGFKSAAK